ncbi:MAG: hypothetical protein EOP20_07285, partial [Hyphomicrobiales bacterium]
FGAFMAGVIMPANVRFRNIFIEKVDDVSTVLLLPLFFVFTGLRTQIGLLDEPYLWKICAAIIAVAVIGKFLGSAIADYSAKNQKPASFPNGLQIPGVRVVLVSATPTGKAWDAACGRWVALASDDTASFDREIRVDARDIRSMVSWGTNPSQVIAIDGLVPDPATLKKSMAAGLANPDGRRS